MTAGTRTLTDSCLSPAADGVHRIHLRRSTQNVPLGQLQRHRDVLRRHPVGQQQPDARVGDGHAAQRPAAAHNLQLLGQPLRGQVGVAREAGERILQQGADIAVLIGLGLALHGHADEADAVLLREANVAVTGDVGVADL